MRSAMPLAGFIAGVAIGGRLAPALLEGGAESPYAPRSRPPAASCSACSSRSPSRASAQQPARAARRAEATGRIAGFPGRRGPARRARVRRRLGLRRGRAERPRDRTRASCARPSSARRSSVALNDAFPPSGPLLNALRRIDPERGRPRAARRTSRRPTAGSSTTPTSSAPPRRWCGFTAAPAASGSRARAGSPGPELVVTNAHVVAGQDDTDRSRPVRRRARGAACSTTSRATTSRSSGSTGLADAPLGLAPTAASGHCRGAGRLPRGRAAHDHRRPARRTGTVISEDSYGRGPVERRMTPFRGDVRNGNSGGPVVDGDGDVLTTVFATSLAEGPAERPRRAERGRRRCARRAAGRRRNRALRGLSGGRQPGHPFVTLNRWRLGLEQSALRVRKRRAGAASAPTFTPPSSWSASGGRGRSCGRWLPARSTSPRSPRPFPASPTGCSRGACASSRTLAWWIARSTRARPPASRTS